MDIRVFVAIAGEVVERIVPARQSLPSAGCKNCRLISTNSSARIG
ncbi:MAG: hypothetical protein WA172_10555 [Terriglobales bacterium]